MKRAGQNACLKAMPSLFRKVMCTSPNWSIKSVFSRYQQHERLCLNSADAAVFMASRAAKQITGMTLKLLTNLSEKSTYFAHKGFSCGKAISSHGLALPLK